MPAANPAALDFLLNRRSRPAKTLTLPVPTAAELAPILTAALRVPDHGKLEPWRLIVLTKPAMARLADLAETRARDLGLMPKRPPRAVASSIRASWPWWSSAAPRHRTRCRWPNRCCRRAVSAWGW